MNKKISELTAATTLSGTELVPIATGGTTKSTTTAAIAALGGGAVNSVNGKTGTVVLVKADVGLGNVDNTADASKPVSTAQAAADAAMLASANATTAAHSGRTDNPHSVTAAQVGAVAKAGDTMTGTLNWSTTQTIASAATTDIGSATSNVVIISGTTTITGLGTIAAGAERCVTFSGALTLTHNATSLILPGGTSINTAAGDVAYFVSLGAGNWRCTGYQKANGQAVVASGALTNFAEAVNTAAPNATVPVVSLTATNAATNVDIALVPKGTGAIVVQVADGTITGGNKRGANAVDLQIIRSNPAEVASGAYSFIAGRYNKVSGPSSAAIGEAHYVSGPVCFAGGFRNTVSSVGGYGCAFGYQNTVSGTASMAIGSNNVADADNSIATGWYATSRGIAGTMQHAGSRRAADGDRQFRHIPQSTVTSNATATVLTSNGAAESTGNTWVLPANYSGIMHGFVIARNTANNDSIGWELKAMVSRDSTAASVAILGSASVVGVGTADVSMTSCGLAVGANTTNGSITITATGLAATTIAWNGYLHCIKNG